MTKDLKSLSKSKAKISSKGIIKLLVADHNLIRALMKMVKSERSTDSKKMSSFREMIKVIKSHVKSEEQSFLSYIKDNNKFEDNVSEGYEEHRVHETILAGINKIKNKDRKIQQMKIFCEVLEHHLDEEEEELFPKFKKYAASSTHKKIGHKFLTTRKRTNFSTSTANKGSLRFGSKVISNKNKIN